MRFLLEEGKKMKKEAVYESPISTGRWLVYGVPGNVGWIMYLVCLIRCLVKQPVCMEIPLVSISLMVGCAGRQ